MSSFLLSLFQSLVLVTSSPPTEAAIKLETMKREIAERKLELAQQYLKSSTPKKGLKLITESNKQDCQRLPDFDPNLGKPQIKECVAFVEQTKKWMRLEEMSDAEAKDWLRVIIRMQQNILAGRPPITDAELFEELSQGEIMKEILEEELPQDKPNKLHEKELQEIERELSTPKEPSDKP